MENITRIQELIQLENIEAKYKADEIHEKDIKHKVLVVYVHNSVDAIETKLTEVGLYKCSRKAWSVSEERVKKADFVIARYKGGLIKEIYKPKMWYKYPTDDGSNRYAFEGDVVIDSNIRELYINKVLKLTQESRGWPTRYINI